MRAGVGRGGVKVQNYTRDFFQSQEFLLLMSLADSPPRLLIDRTIHAWYSIVVTPVNFPTLHTQPTRQATQWPRRENHLRSAAAKMISPPQSTFQTTMQMHTRHGFAASTPPSPPAALRSPSPNYTGHSPSCQRHWLTTISPLCNNPSASADSYAELQLR
jgi:hypothetical protein